MICPRCGNRDSLLTTCPALCAVCKAEIPGAGIREGGRRAAGEGSIKIVTIEDYAKALDVAVEGNEGLSREQARYCAYGIAILKNVPAVIAKLEEWQARIREVAGSQSSGSRTFQMTEHVLSLLRKVD